MPSVFSPLAKALLDGFSEGVVVFDADGKLLYANQQAREALAGMDLADAGARPAAPAGGDGRPASAAPGRRRSSWARRCSFPVSKVPPRWLPGKKRLSSRHSTRITGSSPRRPGTWASAAPLSGVVSRRMGYTETAGANGRKFRSRLPARRRRPDPHSRLHLHLPTTAPAVQQLVERAMARRRAGDSAVADYRARIHYRLTVGLGRRRWARVPAAAVEEQVADVQWQRPNDLRVDVVGRRSRSRSADARSSPACGTGPGSCPARWTTRSASSATSSRRPARFTRSPPPAPSGTATRCTSGLTVAPGRRQPLRLIRVDVTPRRTGPGADRRPDVDRLRHARRSCASPSATSAPGSGSGRTGPHAPIPPPPAASTRSPTRSSASTRIWNTAFRTPGTGCPAARSSRAECGSRW